MPPCENPRTKAKLVTGYKDGVYERRLYLFPFIWPKFTFFFLREREEKMGMKRLKYQGQQVTNDMLNLVLAEAEIFLFCLLKIRKCWNL